MEFNAARIDIDKFVFVLSEGLNQISTLVSSSEKASTSEQDDTTMEYFIDSFNLFIQSTRRHMEDECSPKVECQTPSHENWDDQDRKREVEELKQKLEMIKEKYRKEEEGKRQLIEEYGTVLEEIEVKKREDLNEIAKKADEEMMREWQAVDEELNSLQTEEHLMRRKFEYLCSENMKGEKLLREDKAKAESKLEEFIALYDEDLGRKHEEYENIVHQHQLEDTELKSLVELFEQQKPIYLIMCQEKDVWREKELSRKLHKLRTMLAHNTISKFLNNYVSTLRENNISIVITKKSKGKKKKQ